MRRFFFSFQFTAVLICLCASSNLAIANTLPEKSATPLISGNAGEYFPYGETYPFESVVFLAGSEGISVRLPLPKGVTAYIVIPEYYTGNREMRLKATPYLSMPTPPDAPRLPDSLGYGFDLQPTGMPQEQTGPYSGTPFFVVFDLDGGKTLAEIDRNPRLRKYCSPALTTFNPHMCAFLNKLPASEHTDIDHAVVMPVRGHLSDHITMIPTIPMGYDHLVTAEITRMGTYIPVSLSKELLGNLLRANRIGTDEKSHVNGIPFIEPMVHAKALGMTPGTDDLADEIGFGTEAMALKALQEFGDDPEIAEAARQKFLKRGEGTFGWRMLGATGIVGRLEQAGYPGAAKMREELVNKALSSFDEHIEGYTDKYTANDFNMLDAIIAGAEIEADKPFVLSPTPQTLADIQQPGNALAAKVRDYAHDYLEGFKENHADAEYPHAFLRAAQTAHATGSPLASEFAGEAYERVSAAVDDTLENPEEYIAQDLQKALKALRMTGLSGTKKNPEAADMLQKQIETTVKKTLRESHAQFREGHIDDDFLEGISDAILVGHSENLPPDDLLLTDTSLDTKRDDKDDPNITIRDKDDTGSDETETENPAGDGDGDGDGDGGRDEDEDEDEDEDDPDTGDDPPNRDRKDGKNGKQSDNSKKMPCVDLEVERKNLSNFADQTHWMAILKQLQEANFQMDCGKDEPPLPKPDPKPDNTKPPKKTPKDKEEDECVENVSDLPDSEKDELIKSSIEHLEAALEEIRSAIKDFESSSAQQHKEVMDFARQVIEQARQDLAANPDDANAQAMLAAGEKGISEENKRYQKDLDLLDEMKKKEKLTEDALKQLRDLLGSGDKNETVCKMMLIVRENDKMRETRGLP